MAGNAIMSAAEQTAQERMNQKIVLVRAIAEEEITVTRGELHNLLRLSAATIRRNEEFDATHRSNAIKGEHETARRIYDRTLVRYQALKSVDLSIYYANKGWTAAVAKTAVQQ